MIVCHKCGTRMLENFSTCPSCGAAVVNAAPEETTAAAAQEPEVTANTQASAPAFSPTPQPRTARATQADAPRKTGGTMTKALVAALVAVVLAIGTLVWQSGYGRGGDVNITAEDMTLIAESLPPQQRMMLASSEDERKKLSKDLAQMLALGEEARREGIAARPEVKRQLEIGRSFVIAQNFVRKQQEAGVGLDKIAPKEEVDNFLKEPGRDAEFGEYLKVLQSLQPGSPEIPEEQKNELREDWARLKVVERKALAANVDKERKVQLQIKLQQAGMLARIYSKDMAEKMKPTDQEIDSYIAAHPEHDPKELRKKAEEILQRARAGENFEALAKEFSTEPRASESGGDLGWFGRGMMLKPFEDAAFALQEGQISDIVETQFGLHVIKVEGRRTDKGPDGQPEEQVKARHILISAKLPASPSMMPASSPREQVTALVQQEKQEKFVADLIKRTGVKVADNFTVNMPQMPQGGMFPGAGSPHGQEGPPAPEVELPAEDEGDASGDKPKTPARPRDRK